MVATVIALGLVSSAFAHKPSFSGDYGTPDDAWQVPDPNISIVLYQEITCDLPQLWMTLDGEAGFPLYIQLGVPVIERLEDYRPSVALVGPGLPAPEQELPFDLPDGTGIIVFDSSDVDEPGDFYEPFTQTASWVLVEETVELPETGQAWLVAWDPGYQTGKLWVATGTVEDFSDVETSEFIEWSALVNDFHETDPAVQAAARPERVCEEDASSADSDDADVDADSKGATAEGCSTAPAGLTGLAALAFAVGATILRRREDGSGLDSLD